MTCFWNGIISALSVDRMKLVLKHSKNVKPTPSEFVQLLKNQNTMTPDVSWNGNTLKKQELDENYEMIKTFDNKSISRGYDCSSCEPFLLLVAELFKISINHNYNKTMIRYVNKTNTSKQQLNFASNKGHFWKC
jgi:hypothetical protein